MKIDWDINYEFGIAKCSQMTVSLKEVVKPILQTINKLKINFGFTKIESGKMYQGYVVYISDELLEKTKKSPNVLANYGSQLGESFNEYEWEEKRKDDVKIFLGKFPKQQELADYLKVNKATVSGYTDKKKKLWLNGLWVLKRFKS